MADTVTATAPRRVALVAHPGAELYGSDRMALEGIAGLLEHGWTVLLAVPHDGPLVAEARRLGAETVLIDVPVLRKRLLRPAALLRFVLQSMRAGRRIDALLRTTRPDVVYVSTLTVPLWIIRARRRHVPVLCHVHESERGSRLLQEALARPLMLADRVLVNSVFSRSGLVDVIPSLGERSTVVYNGVAGPPLASAPRRDLDGRLRLVYVGRVSPRKGVDVAIAALDILVRNGFDVGLDVVGGTFPGYEWYDEALRAQAIELGLGERVRFAGFQPTVWQALDRADIALVPSREAEPFGNTAVEALLAARPVVVSDIGGLGEAIEGFSSAIAVTPDDPLALAEAVVRIAANWPAFRRSAQAFAAMAARRFDPALYRERVAKEADAVAGSRSGRRAPELVR